MNLRATSALASGSKVRSEGKEQGWGIPPAPFRGGREICHPPLPLNIFTKEQRALCGCIWRKQVSSIGRLIHGREFLKVQRLPWQSSGAASLGAAMRCLGPLGWEGAMGGAERFPSPPPRADSLGFPHMGGHPSAPRGCFAVASCAGGEAVGCFCPGSSWRRAPR